MRRCVEVLGAKEEWNKNNLICTTLVHIRPMFSPVLDTKARGHAIAVARGVITVRVAVAVDIAEGGNVNVIRRTKPPVHRTACGIIFHTVRTVCAPCLCYPLVILILASLACYGIRIISALISVFYYFACC